MTKYCKYSKTRQTNTGKHYTAYYIINKKYILVQFSVERVFPTYNITSGNADEIIVSLDEKNKTDFNNAIELFSDLQNQYKSFYEKKTVENLVIQFNDIYSKPKLIMFIQSDAIIYIHLQQTMLMLSVDMSLINGLMKMRLPIIKNTTLLKLL